VDTVYSGNCDIPAVSISGHRPTSRESRTSFWTTIRRAPSRWNICTGLGTYANRPDQRPRIFSSDTETRWQAILSVARELGITIDEKLTIQLDSDSPSPEVGHRVTRKLLEAGPQFSALFAFNDISAMGAIKALRETGKRVPEDVSVIGWDDIQGAAFS